MTTASEAREALQLVTGEAIDVSTDLLSRVNGSPEVQRAALLEAVPEVIAYYSDGSSALAADYYEEERERAAVNSRFSAQAVVADRTVKVRRAVAWASEPLFEIAAAASSILAASRLTEVVQSEVARPFRDTITTNRKRDPDSVGWRRITAGGCKFCRLLADRGAVYKASTVRFAAHTNCHCTAQPVFTTNDTGIEASVMQYRASQKTRTPKQRARLREYLNSFYENFPG